MDFKIIKFNLKAEIADLMAKRNFIPDKHLLEEVSGDIWLKDASDLEKAIFTISFYDAARLPCCLSGEKEGTEAYKELNGIFSTRAKILSSLLLESITKDLSASQKTKDILIVFRRGWKIYIRKEIQIIKLPLNINKDLANCN